MYRGTILGVTYHSLETFKKSWNQAVAAGKLVDAKGRKVTKTYKV